MHRPPILPDVLPRARLVRELELFLARPLTLISAPAGYGKSTLASLWLASSAAPSAWLSLDEDDNDLRVFFAYLVAAVRTVYPEACAKVAPILHAAHLPPPATLGRYLMNDIDAVESRFLLVLDDYHSITSSAVHEFVSEMLAHPSPKLHLALLTRRDPPLALGTLRARGLMNEVAIADLRFTRDETATFLEGHLPRGIDAEAGDIVDGKLEGWAAGIRLMAQSLRQTADVAGTLARLDGGFASIVDYLMGEVLAGQPAELARYLIETSILNRLSIPLCEAVHADSEARTAGADAEELLGRLQRDNLFLIALDSDGRWFRYHHLFQKLLQEQLRRLSSPEEISRLHCRASDWFGANGYVNEAIRHAVAGGDTARAVRLVADNRQAVLDAEHWHVLVPWLDYFSPDIERNEPQLLVTRAWVLYHESRLSRIAPVVDRLEELLAQAPELRHLQGEIAWFRAHLWMMSGEGERSAAAFARARREIPLENVKARVEITHQGSLTLHMIGRSREAFRAVDDMRVDPTLPPVSRQVRYWAGRACLHLLDGAYGKAREAAAELVAFAEVSDLQYAVTWGSSFQANACFPRNELDEALECVARVVENRFTSHARAAIDALCVSALVHEIQGSHHDADEVAELLQSFARDTQEPSYIAVASSCRARLALLRGDIEAARAQIQATDLDGGFGALLWWFEVPRLTECRVLLADGTRSGAQAALVRLARIEQENRARHGRYHLFEILALSALARLQLGRDDQAAAILLDALHQGEAAGAVRPFLEPGVPLVKFLAVLAAQHPDNGFLARVLRESSRPEPPPMMHAAARPGGARDLVEPLTNRERDVLELLAKRLQNKEIAEQLYVSSETVKTHVRNLCRKLDAANRREAVARAEALGILSPC